MQVMDCWLAALCSVVYDQPASNVQAEPSDGKSKAKAEKKAPAPKAAAAGSAGAGAGAGAAAKKLSYEEMAAELSDDEDDERGLHSDSDGDSEERKPAPKVAAKPVAAAPTTMPQTGMALVVGISLDRALC